MVKLCSTSVEPNSLQAIRSSWHPRQSGLNLAPVLSVNRDERFGIMFVPFLAADPRTAVMTICFWVFICFICFHMFSYVFIVSMSQYVSVCQWTPCQETCSHCRCSECWRHVRISLSRGGLPFQTSLDHGASYGRHKPLELRACFGCTVVEVVGTDQVAIVSCQGHMYHADHAFCVRCGACGAASLQLFLEVQRPLATSKADESRALLPSQF